MSYEHPAIRSTAIGVTSPPPRRRRLRQALTIGATSLAIAAAVVGRLFVVAGSRDAQPNYVPRDPALRGAAFEFFVPTDRARPRAVVVFLGNDVGFWRPHRNLASDLARRGFAVMGVDIRELLDTLPAEPPARERELAARLHGLEQRAYGELTGEGAALPCAEPTAAAADSQAVVPLLLAGHSLGAELAIWGAAHAPLPALRGVLALSPGSRSHLRISAQDLLMTGEPTEPGSFSVAQEVALVARNRQAAGRVRIAIVRGTGDALRFADTAILAAGRGDARRFSVPLAGHSMKRLITTTPVVAHAMEWLVDQPT